MVIRSRLGRTPRLSCGAVTSLWRACSGAASTAGLARCRGLGAPRAARILRPSPQRRSNRRRPVARSLTLRLLASVSFLLVG